MLIGILDLQGDVGEHLRMAERASRNEDQVVKVKKASQVEGLRALIIPGGESTTLGKLMVKYGISQAIEDNEDLAIFGTCAGAILLAREIEDYREQYTLGKMEYSVQRNAFGRQLESFETLLNVPPLGEDPYPAVFIRAPVIKNLGKGVKALARVNGEAVLAKQGKYLASSFHPELTGDARLHIYFFDIARGG